MQTARSREADESHIRGRRPMFGRGQVMVHRSVSLPPYLHNLVESIAQRRGKDVTFSDVVRAVLINARARGELDA